MTMKMGYGKHSSDMVTLTIAVTTWTVRSHYNVILPVKDNVLKLRHELLATLRY